MMLMLILMDRQNLVLPVVVRSPCGSAARGWQGRQGGGEGEGCRTIVTKYDIKYYVVLFRMPFHRTFATGRTRTYVAVLDNKRLRKCDRRRVRPVAKYLFQVAPSVYE